MPAYTVNEVSTASIMLIRSVKEVSSQDSSCFYCFCNALQLDENKIKNQDQESNLLLTGCWEAGKKNTVLLWNIFYLANRWQLLDDRGDRESA